ncbi:MAG: IS30 family transposase [Psychrobium sp.]|nr:IS30 family transposase [Psychrobium sp.]
MQTYKQLTYSQRCQICTLKKTNISQQKIARIIGASQSAVSRELKRNTGKRGYRFKQAQMLTDSRRLAATKASKMTPQLILLIEGKLKDKWSPEQISGWLGNEIHTTVSHETIYQHIWHEKRLGGCLYSHLRRKGKVYQSRAASQAGRGHIKNRVSIDERPNIVERQTSFTVSTRIFDKQAATISLLMPYKNAVLTITADNGKEFAYHEQVTKALNAPVYFAASYCSWQRGLNENTNGLLRQFWPKKTDFKLISTNEVDEVIVQLNNRPRKKLNYQTPSKLMKIHMAAIAA